MYLSRGANVKVQSIIQNHCKNASNQQEANIFRPAIDKITIDQNLQRDTWIWKLGSKENFSFKKSVEIC